MKAIRLQLANKTLLNAGAHQWDRAPRVHLALRGTEAAAQPSAYVRTAWAGKHVGAVRSLSVQAAHNRQNLFFRLEWADPTHNPDYGDGSVFPDAAAVLFPMNGEAPINRMGSPAAGIRGLVLARESPGVRGSAGVPRLRHRRAPTGAARPQFRVAGQTDAGAS